MRHDKLQNTNSRASLEASSASDLNYQAQSHLDPTIIQRPRNGWHSTKKLKASLTSGASLSGASASRLLIVFDR
jgi:hypothetical protein